MLGMKTSIRYDRLRLTTVTHSPSRSTKAAASKLSIHRPRETF